MADNLRLLYHRNVIYHRLCTVKDGFALIEGSETNEEKSRYFEGLGLGLGVAEGGVDVAAAGDADADTAAAAAAAAADDDDGDDDNDPFANALGGLGWDCAREISPLRNSPQITSPPLEIAIVPQTPITTLPFQF